MKTNSFQAEDVIKGESSEETTLLQKMAQDARRYISSFRWCPPIERVLLAYGVGGVVAVFLVEFTRPIDGGDKAVWVIEGDLPSAYMVTDEIDNPRSAIERYCDLMDDWVNAVLSEKSLKDVFPVKAEASQENAKRLANRIRFLREKIIREPPSQNQ